jgi:hypothetical protein
MRRDCTVRKLVSTFALPLGLHTDATLFVAIFQGNLARTLIRLVAPLHPHAFDTPI